jgi:mono/diheme cytochrome c family protein
MTAWRVISSSVMRRVLGAASILASLVACAGDPAPQSFDTYSVPAPPMPAGTIARSGAPDPIPEDPTLLRSPLAPWPPAGPALAEAAALYRIYCATCHGAEGRGDGPMAELLGVPVRDLADSTVAELADGEIYVTITRGSGQMLGLGGLIPGERERWLLVGAVRGVAAGALRGAAPQP